jgi:16S rRNA C967 or C1407 C5-methylase (RsmB/RsmF family)
MSKAKRAKQDLTAITWQLFDSFYETQWGTSRWNSLKQGLTLPKRHVARVNGFLPDEERQSLAKRFNLDSSKCVRMGDNECEVFDVDMDENAFAKSPPDPVSGIRPYYVMDLASIMPALALNVQPGDRVLDLCAAPGGKTLILAEGIKQSGFLIANEMSAQRRGRLKNVVEEYVPDDVRDRITLTGYDGSKWHHAEENMYDKILVDAPCSGERHLISNPQEFKTWTQKRSKTIAQRQSQLLHSAGIALKVGKSLVYSTCSISHLENDELVQKVIEKHKHAKLEVVKFKPKDCPVGSPSPLGGWQILPDEDDNWGPIYFCMLRRLS